MLQNRFPNGVSGGCRIGSPTAQRYTVSWLAVWYAAYINDQARYIFIGIIEGTYGLVSILGEFPMRLGGGGILLLRGVLVLRETASGSDDE